MTKNWHLKDTESSYVKTFACSDNPRQHIWNKIEKSSKMGHDNKSLLSTFACFLTFNCFCQSLISGRETGH